MNFFKNLLQSYNNSSFRIQKMAQMLLYTSVVLTIACIIFGTIMVITGAVLVSCVVFAFLALCIAVILLIYKNHYKLASNIFLFCLFATMFASIKFDQYIDAYETYVFATLGLVLLIVGSLVGYTRVQLYVIMALNVSAIVILYVFDILPAADGVVTTLHIQNLATSIIMVIIGSITGIILIPSLRTVIAMVEKEKVETQRMLRITEVYTKKSLVSIISEGNDPTTFIPTGKNVAILFCDIRNFTSLSEQMKPIDTINFLNYYFNRMNTVIQTHTGEIDKLMGDGIMASFVNPLDAVLSAHDMKVTLQKYNKERCDRNQSPIRTGIGISFGSVVMGNIGSESKMDYTVIGDVVNQASRLESLTKHYGVDIITTEQIIKDFQGDYRFLDRVKVKGKSEPVNIYEIYHHEPDWIKEKKQKAAEWMEKAFSYYKEGEFLKAAKIYKSLITKLGTHSEQDNTSIDPALNFFYKRCHNLNKAMSSGMIKREHWKGIYSFAEK